MSDPNARRTPLSVSPLPHSDSGLEGTVIFNFGGAPGGAVPADNHDDTAQTVNNRLTLSDTLMAELEALQQYELLAELGRGGMGVVFKAREKSLGRLVALKVLNPSSAAETQERFMIEARSAAKLTHPGIVPIFEIGTIHKTPYFTMAFIDGGTLASHIDAAGPLPTVQAVKIIRQVALAVDYAHQNNIIHRDLKPDNVLIDDQGNARLTDFGLAKDHQANNNLTTFGTVLGTPSYMAPEQARGGAKSDTKAVDIYALGACLYTCLVGRPPFTGETPFDVMIKAAQESPPPPSLVVRAIPRDLDAICLRCLEKKPEHRFPSAAAVAEALDAWLTQQSAADSMASFPVLPPTPQPRRGTHLGLNLGIAAASVSCLALSMLFVLGPRPNRQERAADGGVADVGAVAEARPAPETRSGQTVAPNPKAIPSAGSATPAAANVAPDSAPPPANPAPANPAPAVTAAVAPLPATVEPGTVFMTNSIGMKFVLVPEGRFVMGSPASEPNREPGEDQHPVTITKPFWLGVYPVTQAEYERLTRANPSSFASTGEDRNAVLGLDTRRFPVESVSWQDAVDFCLRLKVLAGERDHSREYRLPTEAEWEYACRGGATAPFGFGATLTPKHANFGSGNLHRPTPVGSYPPNKFGLCDMHGNVNQWCSDWFDAYPAGPATDPTGPRYGTHRLLRGGCFMNQGQYCRSAYRNFSDPGIADKHFGFRIAFSAAAP